MHASPDSPQPHPADRSFGILTLATRDDYLKAIGLALSARVSNPGVPLAVACSKAVAPFLEPYFDFVIEEKPGLRGFVHKVYLDEYSPFDETFFFDSDVLLFRPVKPYAEAWGKPVFASVGAYVTGGVSPFGLDRVKVIQKLGVSQLVHIDGAGHSFFRKPDCCAVFEMARTISNDYGSYAGEARYCDEDVMNIVMTLRGLAPAPYGDFFSRYVSAKPGTLRMDASDGTCEFIWVDSGKTFKPCMMHFAANEAPVAYTRELVRLFRHFGVPTSGLWGTCATDLYLTKIRWPVSYMLRRLGLR